VPGGREGKALLVVHIPGTGNDARGPEPDNVQTHEAAEGVCRASCEARAETARALRATSSRPFTVRKGHQLFPGNCVGI
jgi:hypothetical protein